MRAALARSGGGPVAVVTIARIYGSSMGLPNPGLMPTRKEMEAQKSQVEKALRQDREGRERGLGPGGRLSQTGQDHCAGGEGARRFVM